VKLRGFTRRRILLIIILALFIRFTIFPFILQCQERIFTISDAYQYDALARNIVENHKFCDSEEIPYDNPVYKALIKGSATPFDTFRTPVYPLFLAGIYSLFGYKPYIAIIIQLFLSSLTCILVYRIGEVFVNRDIGFIGGVLLALDFPTAVYANLLLTETLFIFLFLSSLYFFLSFFKEKKRIFLGFSALLLGVSTLTRPIVQYFVILMIGIIFIIFRKDIQKGLINGFIYFSIFLVVISFWAFRNYIIYGNFALSTVSGYNLLFYNAAYLRSYREAGGYDYVKNIRKELKVKMDKICEEKNITSPFERSKLYKEEALEEIFAHPGVYAKLHFIGIAKMFATPTFPISERIFGIPLDNLGVTAVGKGFLTKSFGEAFKEFIDFFLQNWKALLYLPFLVLYLIFLYLMAVYGVYKILKEGRPLFPFFLFLLIIIYNALLIGIAGTARLRIPLMPYIDLIAAYGIYRLMNLRREYV